MKHSDQGDMSTNFDSGDRTYYVRDEGLRPLTPEQRLRWVEELAAGFIAHSSRRFSRQGGASAKRRTPNEEFDSSNG